MSNINYDYINSYIESVIPENQGILKEIEDYGIDNQVPIITKDVEQLLKTILAIKKPKYILELGTAIGYSAILMASQTDEDTKIISIERNEKMYKKAKENIEKAGYSHRIEVVFADAKEIIEELDGPFDFVFLDAAKGQYKNFFDKIEAKLLPEAIVFSDNILFKGMVANDDLVIRRKKTIVKRLREYIVYLMNLDNYTTSIIPIGDGVALTHKEGA